LWVSSFHTNALQFDSWEGVFNGEEYTPPGGYEFCGLVEMARADHDGGSIENLAIKG
jgi:hypothetical protein